jgi:crotonobetainyl-CoA:carnitine CoA-transferase CaiB-like acyl-CoA transferase
MWHRLVGLVGADELRGYDSNRKRLAHRSEVEDRIARFTSSRPLQQLLDLFADHGIAGGRFYSVADIFADPQISHRENIVPIWDETLQCYLSVQAPIPHFSTLEPRLAPAPRLGEHTQIVLTDLLGMTSEQLRDLEDRGLT